MLAYQFTQTEGDHPSNFDQSIGGKKKYLKQDNTYYRFHVKETDEQKR